MDILGNKCTIEGICNRKAKAFLFTHPKSALRKFPFYGHFQRWVLVQVPLPAVLEDAVNLAGMLYLSHFFAFGFETKSG